MSYLIEGDSNGKNEMPIYLPKGIRHLVFFDGTCRFCNHSVEIIYRYDKQRVFHFAALNSVFKESLIKAPLEKDSLVFVSGGKIYYQSDAVLHISKTLGYPLRLLYVFKVVPKKWRDSLYDWVARNRIKWFGESGSCFLPKEEDKKRFHP